MPNFYNPIGNYEVWNIKPEGYFTQEEWSALHPPETPAELTLPEIKAGKKIVIASSRYAAEIAGITFSGYGIATDRDSQALITGAALAAIRDSSYSVRWKTATGFITLTSDQILSVAQAVRAHVQECFDKEADLAAAVDEAENITALENIVWT